MHLPFYVFADTNSTQPNVPSFSFHYKGETLHCEPQKTITSKNRRNLVEYTCIYKNKNIINKQDSVLKDDNQGRSEAERLRQEVKNNGQRNIPYTVKISQKDVYHPYVAANSAKRQLENRFYGEVLDKLLPARFYISLRPQFSTNSTESGLHYKNAGSKAGFYYYYLFDNDLEVMTQYEANIKNNDDEAFIDFSDLSNSSRRLSYLSLKYGDYSILYGKYWSAYYDVADFTDYFRAFGKQGTGAYNNGGDGSESGTGRVDNMLQLHIKKESYTITTQYQFAHDGPDNLNVDYQYSMAASFVYNGFKNISMGTALSYAKFDEITPSLHALGIRGEDQAYIIGMTYKYKEFVANMVFSYTKNHMNDNLGNYFDSVGAELYMHYDFTKNIRFGAGGNWLVPHDERYLDDFSIKKGLLTLQYTFGEATFDDLVYLEVSLPKGHLAKGESLNPTIAIGLRYLFDF